MEKPLLRIITGPTASGKEAAALALAERLRGEIVVVDSMKIYHGLDIGTAKPTAEMRARVPHHCVDFVPVTENFSVADYVREAEKAIARIVAAGRPVIMVGGTALYYKGLLEGLCDAPAADSAVRAQIAAEAGQCGLDALYRRLQRADPAAAAKIHPHDERRIVRALEVLQITGRTLSERQTQWADFHAPGGEIRPAEKNRWRDDFDVRMAVLEWPRPVIRARIRERIERMLKAGLLEEARDVFARRETLARAPLQAVAYKEFFPYFEGAMPLPEAIELLKTRTCQLAKSQMTWFRKFPAAHLEIAPDAAPAQIIEAVAAAWENSADQQCAAPQSRRAESGENRVVGAAATEGKNRAVEVGRSGAAADIADTGAEIQQ